MQSQCVYISPSCPINLFGYYDTPIGYLEITDDGKLIWTDAKSARTIILREHSSFSPFQESSPTPGR